MKRVARELGMVMAVMSLVAFLAWGVLSRLGGQVFTFDVTPAAPTSEVAGGDELSNDKTCPGTVYTGCIPLVPSVQKRLYMEKAVLPRGVYPWETCLPSRTTPKQVPGLDSKTKPRPSFLR